jgi:hypothetical protein
MRATLRGKGNVGAKPPPTKSTSERDETLHQHTLPEHATLTSRKLQSFLQAFVPITTIPNDVDVT